MIFVTIIYEINLELVNYPNKKYSMLIKTNVGEKLYLLLVESDQFEKSLLYETKTNFVSIRLSFFSVM